jgi:hypothetical protein
MAAVAVKGKPDRIVYTSAAKAARRGVYASASSRGWAWVKAKDNTLVLYVSMGFPERNNHKALPCLQCGYAEAALLCPKPVLCMACAHDTVALKGLEIQELYGVDLGWKTPDATERFARMGKDEAFGMGTQQKRRR